MLQEIITEAKDTYASNVSTTVPPPPSVQHGHDMTERVSLSGQWTVRPERVVRGGGDSGGVSGIGGNCGGQEREASTGQ